MNILRLRDVTSLPKITQLVVMEFKPTESESRNSTLDQLFFVLVKK